MAPNIIWSSLSSLSSEMPSSEDRTMRVMLWKGKMRQTNESRPGKQVLFLWPYYLLSLSLCWCLFKHLFKS
uniref:Uncharacterized protein n=1 Tax=Castor canadensis TaxID=51338 RepID=A0A8C0XZL9_CASCN